MADGFAGGFDVADIEGLYRNVDTVSASYWRWKIVSPVAVDIGCLSFGVSLEFERGCWVEHDGEEVVVWVFKNGDVLVRHLHGERWLLGVAPLSELSYLRPADAVSEHVLTLQGQWGKSDGPVELTWLEVQAGMERAERCVAKWPKWKRDLQ